MTGSLCRNAGVSWGPESVSHFRVRHRVRVFLLRTLSVESFFFRLLLHPKKVLSCFPSGAMLTVDGFPTVCELVIRSGSLDLLRTPLVCVDREFFRFINSDFANSSICFLQTRSTYCKSSTRPVRGWTIEPSCTMVRGFLLGDSTAIWLVLVTSLWWFAGSRTAAL